MRLRKPRGDPIQKPPVDARCPAVSGTTIKESKETHMTKITRIPPRIARRPNPSEWGLDELLTFEEAAALHWPEGWPLTPRSLRSAAEAGTLGTVIVSRKRLTTRRQIAEMSRCECRIAPRSERPRPVVAAMGIGMRPEEARAGTRPRLPPTK